MPQAVTHILVPIIIVALWRDYYLKGKEKRHFPLHYVLIAGLGGVLPDIDIIFSFFLSFAGVENWNIHKTFTHSLFFPIVLFAGFAIFSQIKKARVPIRKFHLKFSTIFLMLTTGVLVHIALDSIFGERSFLFYPFSRADYGINLISLLPEGLSGIAMPTLDGILLVLWVVYLELKHKISDFV